MTIFHNRTHDAAIICMKLIPTQSVKDEQICLLTL